MRRGRTAGFTLVEALAAVALFALAAAAIGVLATSSMLHTARNRHATTAAMLAQEQVEALRGLRYDDIAGGTDTVTVAGRAYTVATDVEDDTPAAGMKRIGVSVSWTGPEGSRSYDVETIFTAVRG